MLAPDSKERERRKRNRKEKEEGAEEEKDHVKESLLAGQMLPQRSGGCQRGNCSRTWTMGAHHDNAASLWTAPPASLEPLEEAEKACIPMNRMNRSS